MNGLDNYHKVLGISTSASREEIKQAYRDLVRVWHPDRFSHDPKLQAKAQEKLKEINTAYRQFKKSWNSQDEKQEQEKTAADAETRRRNSSESEAAKSRAAEERQKETQKAKQAEEERFRSGRENAGSSASKIYEEDGNRFRVCPKCKERNNPAFSVCWACRTSLGGHSSYVAGSNPPQSKSSVPGISSIIGIAIAILVSSVVRQGAHGTSQPSFNPSISTYQPHHSAVSNTPAYLPSAPQTENLYFFKNGDSKSRVYQIQGTPDRIEDISGEAWLFYGNSYVQFDANDRVKHAYGEDLKYIK